MKDSLKLLVSLPIKFIGPDVSWHGEENSWVGKKFLAEREFGRD